MSTQGERDDFWGVVGAIGAVVAFAMLLISFFLVDSRAEWEARYTEHMKTHEPAAQGQR